MTAALLTGYDWPLVVLSVLIAMLASYTAIDMSGRVTMATGWGQVAWLSCGAIALGMGIWSMHFIGMLAFRLPVAVEYRFYGVALSMLPALLVSGLAMYLVSQTTLGWAWLVAGSIVMGSGIATMHYAGMAAMHSTAMVVYNLGLVKLSVLIAIAVSFVGLLLVFQLREAKGKYFVWKKLIASVVMGAAIPTMHYVGMAAARFVPTADTVLLSELQTPSKTTFLTVAIAITTIVVFAIAWISAFLDRRFLAQLAYARAVQENRTHLNSILQGVQVGVFVVEGEHIQLSNQAVLDLLQLSNEAELQRQWNAAVETAENFAISEANSEQNRLPSAEPDDSLSSVFRTISVQQSVRNRPLRVEGPTQGPIFLLANAVPLDPNAVDMQNINASTAKDAIICTFSEVTELKAIEKNLKESESKFKTLAQQRELLNRLSTQIRQSLDLNTILQTAVYEVRKFFETDRALIYRFNERWQGSVTVEDVAIPWQATLGEAADDCFPPAYLEQYRHGRIQKINNVAEANLAPEHLAFLQRLQVQANLIVPIMVSAQLWGLLIVHQCSQPRSWKTSEGDSLYELALQIGIAIQQADLYAKAENSVCIAQAQARKLEQSEAKLKQQTIQLEQALQSEKELQSQLVQGEKMSSLGQLVAGIAHEINNPVNFIHGNLRHVDDYTKDLLETVQLYDQHYPEPHPELQEQIDDIDLPFLQTDLKKVIASMRVGTDRIRQIVLSLRNFSRMDESDLKQVDIHEGIDSTLMILQHRLKMSPGLPEIEVIRDYDPLPQVYCYPGQLNQVVMNILVNAIDALEDAWNRRSRSEDQFLEDHLPEDHLPEDQQSRGKITIRTTAIDADWIEIAIADNGPGIPPAICAKIFDPFFTTKPVGKGTGMGMSISYKIIAEGHGGKLTFASSAECGTEFSIRIPTHQKKK
ncbi:MAG: MHYT domain-containing protein [Cyanobacteria bacterium P01_D01_bin.1]